MGALTQELCVVLPADLVEHGGVVPRSSTGQPACVSRSSALRATPIRRVAWRWNFQGRCGHGTGGVRGCLYGNKPRVTPTPTQADSRLG